MKLEGGRRRVRSPQGIFALLFALFVCSLLRPALAVAQQGTETPPPAASPSPTPYPPQDPPAVLVPPGFDDAIATPIPTPDPAATPLPPGFEKPPDWQERDDFFREDLEKDAEWDPNRMFPGNYWALPVTIDAGWRPCLECAGDVYRRPGEVVFWAGYAFQAWPQVTSPFAAVGAEWQAGSIDERGVWRPASRLTPTVRWGWNFSAASVYAVTGVVLPSGGRDRAGWHAGVGVSSFAFLAFAACAAEAIPSVIEIGGDFLEDEETGRTRGAWTVKLGWGW